MSLGCSAMSLSSLVDYSVVSLHFFFVGGHFEVDHSVVDFLCSYVLVLSEACSLLLVGNGGLWVCPY